jgi:hypothetical protein
MYPASTDEREKELMIDEQIIDFVRHSMSGKGDSLIIKIDENGQWMVKTETGGIINEGWGADLNEAWLDEPCS